MVTRDVPKRATKRPARLDETLRPASEPTAKEKKVCKPKKKKVVEPAAADPLPAKRAAALRKARPVKTPEEQEEAQRQLDERVGSARAVKAWAAAAFQEVKQVRAHEKDLKAIAKVLKSLVDKVVLEAANDRKAERASEIDRKQFEERLRHIAPSDQEGTTTTPRAVLRILSTISSDLVDNEPNWSRVLRPLVDLVAEAEPPGHVLAFASKVHESLSAGYAAGVQAGGKSDGRLAFLKAANHPGLHRELYLVMHHAAVPPGLLDADEDEDEDPLGPALFTLHHRVLLYYYELNAPELAPPADTEVASLDAEEMGVVMYLSGWAVREELARTYRGEKAALPLLQQLLQPAGEPLPAANAAVQYVAARELYGGLLRVRMGVTAWFAAVELVARSYLTMERLLVLREAVMDMCVLAVKRSSDVARKFDALLTCEEEAERVIARDLMRRLAARRAPLASRTLYLHARAAAFRKEVMQAIKDKKSSMSIRSVLKAGMLSTHAGKKAAKQKEAVSFSRAMLGSLPPAAIHGILTAVVSTSPEGLDCLIKAEMEALLQAYDPTRTGASKGSKVDLRTQLVGAISGHQEFACVSNATLFLVGSQVVCVWVKP